MSLTNNQQTILNAIYNGNKSELEISDYIQLDVDEVSYNLGELEKQGFIKASKSPVTFDCDGGKYIECLLTPKGKVAVKNPSAIVPPQSSRNINIRGTYNENIGRDYNAKGSVLNIDRMSGGTNILGGEINGSLNEVQQRNLAETAGEIQQLLEQLEQSYSVDTEVNRREFANAAISRINSNPPLAKRVFSAIKAGGIAAFEQLLNHPAASFFIGALDDWQSTQEN